MQPWMDRREIELISFYAAGKATMLEWGSGGSTLEFSALVGRYFSIEHNAEWQAKLREQLPPNVEYRLVDPGWPHEGFSQAEVGQFDEYIRGIVGFSVSEFDLILIDGRARIDCALEAAKFQPRGGLLFFHDFWLRRHYLVRCEELLEHYRIIEGITSTPQTLAVFERR